MNVLAPVEAHTAIRELAQRTRNGEPLATVLASMFHKTHGHLSVPPKLPKLTVPTDLQLGPGEVAVAVRLVKHSSGGLRKWIAGAGLTRDDDIAGWVGVLSRAMADELRRRVEAAGGSVVERAG